MTALMWACKLNRGHIIKKIIEAGADLNHQGASDKFNALMWAVKAGHI